MAVTVIDQANAIRTRMVAEELGKQATQVGQEFARMVLTLRRWYLCHPSRYATGTENMTEPEYRDWLSASDDLAALAKECAELPAKDFEEFQQLVADVTKDVEAAK